MKKFITFTKKEIIESMRTYRLLIISVVFIIYGISSPLLAKMTPDIIKMAIPDNMMFELPVPTVIDSWTQFFKNISQTGFIVVVIIFCGMISGEVSKNTLVNIVTKGVSRLIVYLSKLFTAVVIYTSAYFISFGVTYGYSLYFFPGESVKSLLLPVFLMWIYGILLICVTLLFSLISNNNYIGLLSTGGFVIVLMLLNIIPEAFKFNPITLSEKNVILMTGELPFNDITPSIIVSICLVVLIPFISVKIFNKKQI